MSSVVKMMKRKPIFVLFLVLLVGGGIAFSFKSKKIEIIQNNYHAVKEGDFLVSIVEGGTLTATSEIVVRNETDYTLQIIDIVQEGTVVKKGDLLVEMDSSNIREKIASQELSVEAARQNVVDSTDSLALGRLTWEAEIEEDELKQEFAKSDLEKYKEGDWPIIEKSLEAKITISEAELERAKDRLVKTEALKAKGYATEVELAADRLSVKKQQLNIDQYQQELAITRKYDYPKRVRLLEANVKDADLDLLRTRQKAKTSIASYESSLESRERTLKAYEERLANYQEQLELCKIMAPRDGLVVYQQPSSYRYPGIEVGSQISSKYRILKLPDVSQMMLDIKVHESHVRQVRAGLPCYITIDSMPDTRFTGFIRKVAPLPDTTSRYYNPNLKVYNTEVWINEKLSDLKPGVSGRAEIVVTNLANVLTVPIQAVTTSGGKQVCFVSRSGGDEAVEVEIGMFNDTMIEVKSGLAVGDEVLLSPLSLGDQLDMEGGFVTDGDLAGPKAAMAPSPAELLAAQMVGQGDDIVEGTNDKKAKAKKAKEAREKTTSSNKVKKNASSKPDRVKRTKKTD
jgi:HlyD family secretion protein